MNRYTRHPTHVCRLPYPLPRNLSSLMNLPRIRRCHNIIYPDIRVFLYPSHVIFAMNDPSPSFPFALSLVLHHFCCMCRSPSSKISWEFCPILVSLEFYPKLRQCKGFLNQRALSERIWWCVGKVWKLLAKTSEANRPSFGALNRHILFLVAS